MPWHCRAHWGRRAPSRGQNRPRLFARRANESVQGPRADRCYGAVRHDFFFSSRRRHTRCSRDWSSDVCSSDLGIDGNPDSQRMGHFQEALAQARQLAQDRLHGNPQDDEGLFALTLAAGMESDALSILEKKHLEALKRMKEANKYAKQLLAQRPDAADAYIAPGIANYMVGSLNSGSRFALWFGGIHGDKRLGMAQVAKTAEQGRYLQPFAKIVLALAARRENQIRLAQRLLRELKDQYPDSVLFASEYAKATSARSGD